MASSKLTPEFRIHWAEFRFPPLNLWVMASLSSGLYPDNGNAADAAEANNAPSKNSRALHKLHRRLETLLAVRGGKV